MAESDRGKTIKVLENRNSKLSGKVNVTSPTELKKFDYGPNVEIENYSTFFLRKFKREFIFGKSQIN